jgi:hypothetical protein
MYDPPMSLAVGQRMYDPPMSLSAWYVHKVIQCSRLAEAATSPSERRWFESEREGWRQVLAEEIGAEAATLEIAMALEV